MIIIIIAFLRESSYDVPRKPTKRGFIVSHITSSAETDGREAQSFKKLPEHFN